MSGFGTFVGSYTHADKRSCESNLQSSRGYCSRQISEVNSQHILALENQYARTTDDFSTIRNLARESFGYSSQVDDPNRNTLEKQSVNPDGIHWGQHIDFETLDKDPRNLNQKVQ